MFKITGEKSPERVLEHRYAEEDDGQGKANLVGDLRGVSALGFIGHVLHLFTTTGSPHLNILNHEVSLASLSSHHGGKRFEQQHQCKRNEQHGRVVIDVA